MEDEDYPFDFYVVATTLLVIYLLCIFKQINDLLVARALANENDDDADGAQNDDDADGGQNDDDADGGQNDDNADGGQNDDDADGGQNANEEDADDADDQNGDFDDVMENEGNGAVNHFPPPIHRPPWITPPNPGFNLGKKLLIANFLVSLDDTAEIAPGLLIFNHVFNALLKKMNGKNGEADGALYVKFKVISDSRVDDGFFKLVLIERTVDNLEVYLVANALFLDEKLLIANFLVSLDDTAEIAPGLLSFNHVFNALLKKVNGKNGEADGALYVKFKVISDSRVDDGFFKIVLIERTVDNFELEVYLVPNALFLDETLLIADFLVSLDTTEIAPDLLSFNHVFNALLKKVNGKNGEADKFKVISDSRVGDGFFKVMLIERAVDNFEFEVYLMPNAPFPDEKLLIADFLVSLDTTEIAPDLLSFNHLPNALLKKVNGNSIGGGVNRSGVSAMKTEVPTATPAGNAQPPKLAALRDDDKSGPNSAKARRSAYADQSSNMGVHSVKEWSSPAFWVSELSTIAEPNRKKKIFF
ncbi:hypothetical protein niasHT_036256 [Heterodera trifolii]|uniref:Uncharacterized protein n=1 Tax=Heterodera trifolii TaxID=157864 RepID=A0ABD2IDX8_9BILA